MKLICAAERIRLLQRMLNVEVIEGSNPPSPRTYIGMRAIGDQLISYGGWNGTANTRELIEFSLTNKTWTILQPSVGDTRHSYAMAAVDDKAYILYSAGASSRNSFITHNTITKSTTRTSLAGSGVVPRQETVLENIDGAGYMFGGWDASDVLHNDTVRWTLGSTTMQSLSPANPPAPRRGHKSATLGGKMYILGGRLKIAGQPINEFWSYDPIVNAWTRLADYPITITHGSLLPLGNELIAFGGFTMDDVYRSTNQAFAYNPATDRWTELKLSEDIPGRGGHGAAVVDDELYYFAGMTVEGANTTIRNDLMKLKF